MGQRQSRPAGRKTVYGMRGLAGGRSRGACARCGAGRGGANEGKERGEVPPCEWCCGSSVHRQRLTLTVQRPRRRCRLAPGHQYIVSTWVFTCARCSARSVLQHTEEEAAACVWDEGSAVRCGGRPARCVWSDSTSCQHWRTHRARSSAGFRANVFFTQVAICTAGEAPGQASSWTYIQSMQACLAELAGGGTPTEGSGSREGGQLQQCLCSPSTVRICGTSVRTFLTGSQSARPCAGQEGEEGGGSGRRGM